MLAPGILARGPWRPHQVASRWRADAHEADARAAAAADRAIAALQSRGSPSHDGLAARVADFRAGAERLELELQPMRWAVRLSDDAEGALSVLCVARDWRGRWLAGRRAPWVASWAGRWALGAGGTVEVGEDPVEALVRELREEWSVEPRELRVEALLALPNRMVMLIGQAWLARDAQVVRDHEHDAHCWWPADVDGWPAEADVALRRVADICAP